MSAGVLVNINTKDLSDIAINVYCVFLKKIKIWTFYNSVIVGVRKSKKLIFVLDCFNLTHCVLQVLFLTHPHSEIRDTQKYKPFRELFNNRSPALKKLTDKLLGVSVQEGQHSSVGGTLVTFYYKKSTRGDYF